MIDGRRALCLLLGALFLVQGCAALQDYTRFSAPARASLSRGAYDEALAAFPPSAARGGNEVLIRMERGLVLQGLGRYAESAAEFEAAAKRIEAYEQRAVVSISQGASQAASLVVNEQMLPYEGEDYEKVLVHTFNAMNYLMQGNTEGARVEIRNAYRRQQELYERHARELEQAAADSRAKTGLDAFRQADPQGYEALQQRADTLSGIYQSAFAYYISALVYELNNETDEAYIDLKKGIEAAPHCRAMQADLIRLSRELHYPEDLARWERDFGKLDPPVRDGTDVFLIFELGQGPYREAVRFPIPTRSGFVAAAFPTYRFFPAQTTAAVLAANGRAERSSIVSDLDAIAARTLLDEFPVLVLKQIARAALKGSATHEMAQRHGAIWAFIGSLLALITEQPDLRTWSTLPKQVQVARLSVPKSLRQISVTSQPVGLAGTVSIPEGARHVIILARASDGTLDLRSKAY